MSKSSLSFRVLLSIFIFLLFIAIECFIYFFPNFIAAMVMLFVFVNFVMGLAYIWFNGDFS